jgi:ribonuclease VapC
VSDRIYMLDASALLALMRGEPGGETVEAILPAARISSVNLSEVVAKLSERGVPEDVIASSIAALGLMVVPFDRAQAMHAGYLRGVTRSAGLSLGDRACLAAAAASDAVAMTTDRSWSGLDLGISVERAR